MFNMKLHICRECGNEYYEDLPMCPNCTTHYNEVYGHQKREFKKKNRESSYPKPTKLIISFIIIASQLFIWPNLINYFNNNIISKTNQSISITSFQSNLVVQDNVNFEWLNNRLIIKGTIHNTSFKQINGAMITIALYNDEETILDTSSDFIDQIPANGNWNFDVKFYSVTSEATKYKVINIVENNE